MPIITVQMIKGRTLDQKRQLAKALTDTCEVLKLEPQWVTVLLQDVEKSDWAIGGELQLDKFGS